MRIPGAVEKKKQSNEGVLVSLPSYKLESVTERQELVL